MAPGLLVFKNHLDCALNFCVPFVESEVQYSWSACASSNSGYPVILFVFCELLLLVQVGQRGGSVGQQVAENKTHSSQVTLLYQSRP